ncbi:hypothetical protein [Moraxella equi]|uniref:hypothetical protein n=1 Tax=Moraxella equi TaxID=60442 RepID=UPI00142E5849|nr:hypothetical protein [Moraxella equi]
MTQLTFKKPSIADQASILSFRQAFNAKCPAMHGSNELNAFTDGGFVGWLNYINAPSGTNWFDYEKVADSNRITRRCRSGHHAFAPPSKQHSGAAWRTHRI